MNVKYILGVVIGITLVITLADTTTYRSISGRDLHIQIVSSARISIFSGAGVTHNRLVTHAKASTDNEVYTNKNYSN